METHKMIGPVINPIIENSDEQLPSLSDLHDYEPKLEFDDTEINEPFTAQLQIQTNTLEDYELRDDDESGAPIENPLEDQDFENQLMNVSENLTTTRIKGTFDLLGTDRQGNYVFGIYASKFPDKTQMESFIKEIIQKMENYVRNDYSLVYFHQGMRENNKPSTQLLWNCYKELDRNYRKNLKNLYIVYPTFWIRFMWKFFSTFISSKFRSKLIYYMSLDELHQATGLDITKLPEDVQIFDRKQNAQRYKNPNCSTDVTDDKKTPKTRQFGVTLKFIICNSPCLGCIPPIVRQCVDTLSITGMIDTEGIFRRSGNIAKINELKNKVNKGENVDLRSVDVHVVAGLLKAFLRDLKEPLLTFELYDEIVGFLNWPKEERSRNVTQILRERLPLENYELFKYLIEFLVKIMECEDLNKMTSSNLAIVFGPNLLWSNSTHMSLEEIAPTNAFIDFILQNHKDIYMVDITVKSSNID